MPRCPGETRGARAFLGALLVLFLASACVPIGGGSPAQREAAEREAEKALRAGDMARALRILEPRAESGDVSAQTMVARIYEMDRGGVPKDEVKAAEWNERAAQQGATDAQLRLAEQLNEGAGVPRDALQAYVWAARAAEGGMPGAEQRRRALGERLSQAQRARGDQMAAAWRPTAEPGPLGGVDPTYGLPSGGASSGTADRGGEDGGLSGPAGVPRAGGGSDDGGFGTYSEPQGTVRF